MSDPVEISVRGGLQGIIDELQKVTEKAKETQEAFNGQGAVVEQGLKGNTKRVETMLSRLQGLGRRTADQLRGDFKSLFAVNALTDSIKLSNQFRQVASESVQLSDMIRKLGATFGIAGNQFVAFQTMMTKGLGEIGLSSEVATQTLEGLSTTRVRGPENLLNYSRQAGMLASVGREPERAGTIAQGLADTIQAKGGDVNDPKQLTSLAEVLRKVQISTGAKPSETLTGMNRIFEKMPQDLRKSLDESALLNLATISATGGPNSAKFLEEYLSMSPIQRLPIDMQGGSNLLNSKGFDVEKFKKFADSITSRIGMDPRMSAETLNISPEAAEGFIRLKENLDKTSKALEDSERVTGDLAESYRQAMGMGEAFRATLNRVKKTFAEPIAMVTQKTTDVLSAAAESDAGSAAVAGGALIGAAMLAGAGLKGVGKGMKGIAGAAAATQGAEMLTGKDVIPVLVTNYAQIGAAAGAAGGGTVAGVPGSAPGGKMSKGEMISGAISGWVIGQAIGEMLKPAFNEHLDSTKGSMSELMPEGDQMDAQLYTIDKLLGRLGLGGGMAAEIDRQYEMKQAGKTGEIKPAAPDSAAKAVAPAMQSSQNINNSPMTGGGFFPKEPVKVIVETSVPNLKVKPQRGSQGASN